MRPVHQSPIPRKVVHPYTSSSGLYHRSGGHAFSHLSAGGLVTVSINHWPPSLCRPHPSGSTTLRTASRPHVLDNNATVVAPCCGSLPIKSILQLGRAGESQLIRIQLYYPSLQFLLHVIAPCTCTDGTVFHVIAPCTCTDGTGPHCSWYYIHLALFLGTTCVSRHRCRFPNLRAQGPAASAAATRVLPANCSVSGVQQ